MKGRIFESETEQAAAMRAFEIVMNFVRRSRHLDSTAKITLMSVLDAWREADVLFEPGFREKWDVWTRAEVPKDDL